MSERMTEDQLKEHAADAVTHKGHPMPEVDAQLEWFRKYVGSVYLGGCDPVNQHDQQQLEAILVRLDSTRPIAVGERLPEERRILNAVKTWLRILAQVKYGMPTEADVDHSALLRRLLSGKDPFPQPPPRSFSYPWYELLEKGEAMANVFESNDGKAIVINQSRWEVVEKRDGEYTACWAATGLRCKVVMSSDAWGNRVIVLNDDELPPRPTSVAN